MKPTVEIASVRIFVANLPAAQRFYSDVVGLELTWTDPDVAIFGENPVVVVEALARHGNRNGLVGRFTGIAFETRDADATYARLRLTGVKTHGPPERQDWGGTFLHVDDPSGNTITFLQRPANNSTEQTA